MLHKQLKGCISQTNHKFKKEGKHGLLDISMDVVVEVGYQIRKRRKEKYIVSRYSKNIGDVIESLIERKEDKYTMKINSDDLSTEKR
jgi:predicted transport protein